MRRLHLAALALLALLPIVELSAHARIQANVVPDAELAQAAAFIRSQLSPRDLIVAGPSWADPLLRLHLGDRIPLSMAGRSDTARYERLWVMSVRDALPVEAVGRKAELERAFGKVRVLRYPLGKSPVLFDFVDELAKARVTRATRSGEQPCPWREGGSPRGGGLGRGALYPLRERFQCDERRPWLFVGPVVMEDLSITPRYCIWQHPQGSEPITATWDDVPLGDELVFYGSLYYEHERMREHEPVAAQIRIDGKLRATMTHRDGDGLLRLRVPTGSAERGQVSIAVTARAPDKRTFCWSASTRKADASRHDDAVTSGERP